MHTARILQFPSTVFVKNIILINIVVMIVKVAAAQLNLFDLNNYFAIYDWKSMHFKPYQFLTHMLTHGQSLGANFSLVPLNNESALALQGCITHLAYNMLFLFIFGSFLEHEIGIRKMFFLFIVCGIVAALCHFMYKHYQGHIYEQAVADFTKNSTWQQYKYTLTRNIPKNNFNSWLYDLLNEWELEPNNKDYMNKVTFALNQYIKSYQQSSCVGASGAVMGVVAALVLLRPNAKFDFLLPLPIWIFGLGYFIFELKAGIYDKQADQIAHLAHAGGMIAGFILMYIWKKLNWIK